jgi:hypothetical protein
MTAAVQGSGESTTTRRPRRARHERGTQSPGSADVPLRMESGSILVVRARCGRHLQTADDTVAFASARWGVTDDFGTCGE